MPPVVGRRSGLSRRLLTGMLTTLLIAGAIAARRRWYTVNPNESGSNSMIIIVGAGVAGLSAAARALDLGAKVLLIDKAKTFGGNSRKATSGVNAVDTMYQNNLGIIDSPALFVDDILRSGKGHSLQSVARVLADRSGRIINTMSEKLGMNMSDVNALGGHSAPRTHRLQPKLNDPRPFGAVLVKSLTNYIAGFERIAERGADSNFTHALDKIHDLFDTRNEGQIITLYNTRLIDFEIATQHKSHTESPKSHWPGWLSPPSRQRSPSEITTEEIIPAVRSVTLMGSDGNVATLTGIKALILTPGGFGGDTMSENSLIAKYAPQYIGFPTTNDLATTGDVHKLAIEKGLVTYDLDQIQLHPTSFVNTRQFDAPMKFLCPEVLRSIGAVLVNFRGQRFVDELQTRDVVSQAIINHGGSHSDWLFIPNRDTISATSTRSAESPTPAESPSGGDRSSRSESPSPPNGPTLSKEQHMALLVFSEEMASKFGIAALNFYIKHNLIHRIESLETLTKAFTRAHVEHEVNSFELAYFAIITPAVHYTTGGLLVDEIMRGVIPRSPGSFDVKSLKLDKPIIEQSDVMAVHNLFIAGEAAGGLHGYNRLGGNGMSECMVLGSLAGELSTMVSNTTGHSLGEYPSVVNSQIVSLTSDARPPPNNIVSDNAVESGESTDDSIGELTLALPALNVKLNPAAEIDDLVVEAWHKNRTPIKFTAVRILDSNVGLLKISCRGDHKVSCLCFAIKSSSESQSRGPSCFPSG